MQKVAVKTQHYSNIFNLTGKLPKQQAIEILQQSDVLLATSYENLKGVYPVKMFEYFACRKPVLLCPGDGDEMETFVKETNCGYVANTVDECYRVLEMQVIDKLNGQKHPLVINSSKAEVYTRMHQAGVLAQLLNTQL
jgi:glycosyltransferase involved in cell wall biosynthesis